MADYSVVNTQMPPSTTALNSSLEDDLDELDRILMALLRRGCGPTSDGDRYVARCPFDGSHCLTISNAAPLVQCAEGCDASSILDFLVGVDRRNNALVEAARTETTATRLSRPVWDSENGPAIYGEMAVPFTTAGRYGVASHAFSGRKDIPMNVRWFLTVLTGFLVDFHDPRKGAKASIVQIAQAMGCSETHVEKMIKAAEQRGLIDVYRVRYGAGWLNLYVLVGMINTANETVSRRNETGDQSQKVASADRIANDPYPNPCEGRTPTRVGMATPDGGEHIDGIEPRKEDLSTSRGRGAGGARLSRIKKAELVTADLVADGFPAEEIRAAMAHPNLVGMTTDAVSWAIGDIRRQKTRKKSKAEVQAEAEEAWRFRSAVQAELDGQTDEARLRREEELGHYEDTEAAAEIEAHRAKRHAYIAKVWSVDISMVLAAAEAETAPDGGSRDLRAS